MNENTENKIGNLIMALSSFDDLNRVKARKQLVAIGSPALPSLIEALDDPDSLIKWEAVKAIGEIGDPNASPSLVRTLEDEQFEVRWLAAKGLIKMGVKGLKPLFQALIEHGDSISLREGAHHVLHDLSNGELKQYLVPVLMALEGEAPEVQVPIAALHAMEGVEKFQRTIQERNESRFKQLPPDILGNVLDISQHRLMRRYARSLNKPTPKV